MERHILLSVIVLICINVMDSVMGSVVGPTIIFYLNDLGGGVREYGFISSAGALAAMLAIPAYGKWVDSNGNKYKTPYMSSFILGIFANLIYFAAVLLPKGPIALYSLIFSRFLAGMSAAGRSLSYSWVLSTILPDQQRTIFCFLSASRTVGMVLGPLTNYFVMEIDTEFQIFGLKIPVDPNNSIGLLMVGGEIILIVLTLLFLQEPPEEKVHKKAKSEESDTKTNLKGVMYALSHFDIFLPIFTMFAIISCFMLPAIALSPVARDMGWTPFKISEVSAYGGAIMASGMAISSAISMTNISDMAMLSFGVGSFILGGSLNYMLWTESVDIWQFTLPFYLIQFGYTFIGPANRSRYGKAILDKKELAGSKGIMMGLVNQAASIAGLIVPYFITSFVLRDPADVDASLDKHRLTAGALYAPVLASLVFVGLLYNHFFLDLPNRGQSNNDSDAVSESTRLLSSAGKKNPRSSVIEISEALSRSSESYRRMSTEIMGIPNPVDTKFEKELNEQLLKDKKLWNELELLDAIED